MIILLSSGYSIKYDIIIIYDIFQKVHRDEYLCVLCSKLNFGICGVYLISGN